MSNVGKWIERLFNAHMFVRRFLVFWAASLISWVVLTVFSNLTEITGHVVSALSIVVGLLATTIGFYNYQRRMDKQEQTNVDDSNRNG